MRSSKSSSSSLFSKKFSIFLIMGIILSGITAVGLSIRQNQDIRSNAQGVPFCEDKCIGQKRCDFSTPGPSCCQEVKRTGDPFECGWPDRGYCSDDECSTIPEGVNRQKCGGPRHTWCDLCRQNNCPGYGGPGPTARPKPTNTPNKRKLTPTKNPKPTKTPMPTTIYIPVTATPNPVVTYPPNPTPIIIYITAIPPSETTPEFTNHNLVNTPQPSQNLTNPNTWSKIKNSVANASSGGRNLLENIWARISEFTHTIAP